MDTAALQQPSANGATTSKPDRPWADRRPLHRIKEVREEQGMSHRDVARVLGRQVAEVKKQEQETSDLNLSELYAWQHVLDVPVADLLVEPDAGPSPPVLERARLVKLMKSAAAVLEGAEEESVQRLAQRMIDQLIEIMPELEDISPWHAIGQRRGLDDYGRVVERCLPEDLLYNQNKRWYE